MPIFKTRIQPVIVVPILAPMMMPIACDNCITPLLTNPTTITVVIELDWTTQVTITPHAVAKMRLFVTAPIMRRMLLPAIACMPSDMFFMPSRNSPSPPTNSQISCTSADMSNGSPPSNSRHDC